MRTRRAILGGLSGLGFAGLGLTGSFGEDAFGQNLSKAKIVIIGGGFGGATAALTLKTLSPDIDVTLVEPKKTYYACPFSNLVIAGLRPERAQKFSYDGLSRRGVHIAHALARDISPIGKTVTLSTGQSLSYDRLILSPGISFITEAIEGYASAQEVMPHAWTGGAQTSNLAAQLAAMANGETVIISVPKAPYRCPPGPYERASLIAHYLKTHKPKSKLILLDSKDQFSKQPLFEEAWAQCYPDHIERRGAAEDGRVIRVNGLRKIVSTDFEDIKTSVANIIPPQKAGEIARRAGVVDGSGWCPINPLDFSATLQDDIYVLGDATIATPMPKSAFSAALQARLCSIQIIRSLSGLSLEPTVLTNTCYSFIDPERAVSITGVYSNANQSLSSVAGAGGTTALSASDKTLLAEGQQARDWFKSMSFQAFSTVHAS